MLWDLAGQTKFQRFRHQLYSGAVAALIIYDITQRKSFENVEKWYLDLIQGNNIGNKLCIILCGNKKDLSAQRQVSTEEGFSLAQKMKMIFFETSAETGENIDEAFAKLVLNLFLKYKI
jgi:small GTP-binding protein